MSLDFDNNFFNIFEFDEYDGFGLPELTFNNITLIKTLNSKLTEGMQFDFAYINTDLHLLIFGNNDSNIEHHYKICIELCDYQEVETTEQVEV